ncbi:MAG: riboflavin synthase [Chlorobi bacterium]|nr:riboflavin synthase [Chlorobiota bacterium]
MFTGIIEQTGTVESIRAEGKNKHFDIRAAFFDELRIDQSVAHDGVCLTVVGKDPEKRTYTVTAVEETLRRSRLGDWRPGDVVNLERSVKVNDRLDGHIVQGHVDQTAVVKNISEAGGSHIFTFAFEGKPLHVMVEKGSVAVNGVSLTVFNITPESFDVAIIPYTYEHTNFHRLRPGDKVNIEFDIIGKYVERLAAPYR